MSADPSTRYVSNSFASGLTGSNAALRSSESDPPGQYLSRDSRVSDEDFAQRHQRGLPCRRKRTEHGEDHGDRAHVGAVYRVDNARRMTVVPGYFVASRRLSH